VAQVSVLSERTSDFTPHTQASNNHTQQLSQPTVREYSIEELDLKFDMMRGQMEQKAADITARQIHKLLQDRLESDTLLEGRAALFSV
jgi:hypothetical protein